MALLLPGGYVPRRTLSKRAPCSPFAWARGLGVALVVAVVNLLIYSRRACLEREVERTAGQSLLPLPPPGGGGEGIAALQAEVKRLQAQVAYLTTSGKGAAQAPLPPLLPPPLLRATALEPAPSSPAAARALLVICHNRPAYLSRTLDAVLERLPRYNRPHVYVSQDGTDAGVRGAVGAAAAAFAARAGDVPFTHWTHTPLEAGALRGKDGAPVPHWATGYYLLAQHFGWALGRIFAAGHPRVIVLEDDLEVAVDFFDYFTALEPLLDSDPTLLGASAYSDLGQPHLVADPRAVLRSDFFPGLGWMLTRHAWEELGPKWPDSFWDDWLREPPQRRERHFLRPEVSRTLTFGEQGVSASQFYREFLATVRLNDQAVDWAAEDLQYLQPVLWDAELEAAQAGARVSPTLDAFFEADCSGSPATVLFHYGSVAQYPAVAHRFKFLDDVKAGVPRTAYHGIVTLKHNSCRKLAVE